MIRSKDQIEQFKKILFDTSEDIATYALIDGAACPELRFKMYDENSTFACLWSGELTPDLEEVAPYLILLEKGSNFTDWLTQEGWDNNYGIYINSPLGIDQLKRHFKKFQYVRMPDGKKVLFRFYDPRVLHTFSDIWDESQQSEFCVDLSRIILPMQNSDTSYIIQVDKTTGLPFKSEKVLKDKSVDSIS